MAKTTLDLIQDQVRGELVLNAPMAEYTTIRVGGPADVLIHPADREDLARLVRFLEGREIPRFLLGNGSNLIVKDGGIRGAVISLGRGFSEIEERDPIAGGPTFRVGAGASLRRLVRWTVDRGISGLEALAAIPGTLGGALVMNAGAWGTEIGDLVVEVETMAPSGEVRALGKKALQFGYRHAEIPEGHILLAAHLRGEQGTPEAVKEAVQRYHRQRQASQPTQESSAGSVFLNPPGKSAGQLIDQCGLKGVRVGDAEVSRVHANFIVNAGRATAGQVVELMGMVQERVYAKHRIKLEPEVHVVGAWEKGKLRISE